MEFGAGSLYSAMFLLGHPWGGLAPSLSPMGPTGKMEIILELSS